MCRLLITVKERFELQGRGLALVPSLPVDSIPHPTQGQKLQTKLERPDGTTEEREAKILLEHFDPGGYKLICYLLNTEKGEVPIGTKVWTSENQ